MKNFLDPVIPILEKVVELVAKNPSFNISSSIDKSAYFKNRVSKFFNQEMYSKEVEIDIPPSFYGSRLGIKKDGMSIASFGTSTDKDTALLISQAELLERYSSWAPLDFIKKLNFSRKEIRGNYAKSHTIKSIFGFRFKKFPTDTLYWGLGATDALIKRHITTSGVAGHFSTAEATLHAWLELIERDSFLVHWLNTIAPPRIDLPKTLKGETELSSILNQFDKEKYDYYALDITSDIDIPACLFVIVLKENGNEKIVVSASCGFDGASVIVSALKEACVTANTVFNLEPFHLSEEYKPFTDRRIDLTTRCRAFLTPEGVSEAKFLWSSEKKNSLVDFETRHGVIPILSTSEEKLEYLKSLFKELYKKDPRYDVFLFTFRNSLIRFFGFKVVRVICEALYPMYLTESFADPEHPRLKEFVKNKNLEGVAKLNTFPHPFP